jgi:hypothetical protein
MKVYCLWRSMDFEGDELIDIYETRKRAEEEKEKEQAIARMKNYGFMYTITENEVQT